MASYEDILDSINEIRSLVKNYAADDDMYATESTSGDLDRNSQTSSIVESETTVASEYIENLYKELIQLRKTEADLRQKIEQASQVTENDDYSLGEEEDLGEQLEQSSMNGTHDSFESY